MNRTDAATIAISAINALSTAITLTRREREGVADICAEIRAWEAGGDAGTLYIRVLGRGTSLRDSASRLYDAATRRAHAASDAYGVAYAPAFANFIASGRGRRRRHAAHTHAATVAARELAVCHNAWELRSAAWRRYEAVNHICDAAWDLACAAERARRAECAAIEEARRGEPRRLTVFLDDDGHGERPLTGAAPIADDDCEEV